MKYLIIITILFLNFAVADVKVVASKSCKVDVLTQKEVKDLFMLKKKTINDESVIVVDSSNKKVYKIFVKEYMHKSLRKMKTYWVRMLFTGKKIPPKKIASDKLTTLDSKDNCYLSYVEVENTPKTWKEISVK